MKILFIIVICLLFSGCATTALVPVHTPCLTKEVTKPNSEFDKLPETSPLVELIRSLLLDRESSKQYEADLEAQIKGCK